MIYGPYRGHASTFHLIEGEALVPMLEEYQKSGTAQPATPRKAKYKPSALTEAVTHMRTARTST